MKSNVDETIKLYSGLGWKAVFAKLRFWDAPFLEVEKIVPKKGLIIDLGCGEGIFTNLMALASKDREILGIDIDKGRIKQAKRGLKNATFVKGDVTKVSLPKADCIILFHLLHHLNSFTDQEVVLEKCAKQISIGGKIIVVEVEPRFSYKYLLALIVDHFIVPWLFEQRLYSKIYFRKHDKWIRLLRAYGLSCKVIPAEAGKPFSHRIFECQRL